MGSKSQTDEAVFVAVQIEVVHAEEAQKEPQAIRNRNRFLSHF